MKLDRIFPWAMLAVAALYVASQAIPPSAKPDQPDLPEAEKLAVQDDGRIKPLDSLARVSLMIISSRTEYVDADGKKQPAIRWLLEVMSAIDPDALPGVNPVENPAGSLKVFRIENDQVLSFLGLESRPGSYRYSLKEILKPEKVEKIAAEFARVSEIESKKQNLFEQKIAELSRKVRLYQDLMQRKIPQTIPPARQGERWASLVEIDEQVLAPARSRLDLEARIEVNKNRLKILEKVQKDVFRRLQEDGFDPRTITPEQREQLGRMVLSEHEAEMKREARRIFERSCAEYVREHRGAYSPPAQAFVEILRAWRARETTKFNELVKEYQSSAFAAVPEKDVRKARHEVTYNHFSAFYHCAVLFVIAFVLGCASWLGWTEPLNRASTYVGLLALAVLSLAMLARIYLQGRPPVTNLYSSAIFIGWGCVGVGLILERIYWNGVGNVVGSFLGFATMIIAHHLGMGKDTLENLEAVLDTNFWLATHVTTVTLGYMATMLGGLIGLVFIVGGMFTKEITGATRKSLMQMLYGTICFAMLLSFVGTVLGGIWADQSWGRFWGWDPKENGAVLIVLWNALILHARWGGMVKQRGIAVLSVVGVMVTVWSWFGTNQLGVGLHSYGFSSTLAVVCKWVWISCMFIILMGLLPLKYWRSYADELGGRAAMNTAKNPHRDRPRTATTRG